MDHGAMPNAAVAEMAGRLNAVRVTVKDLLLASREIHKLAARRRMRDARLEIMADLFPAEPSKAQAVELRLSAMAGLIASGALAHWVMRRENDGSTDIAEPVWIATATVEILLSEHAAYFDTDEFTATVLALAPQAGSA